MKNISRRHQIWTELATVEQTKELKWKSDLDMLPSPPSLDEATLEVRKIKTVQVFYKERKGI